MRSQRLIAAAVVIALSGALAGCSSSITNWDPTDLLDFLDTKKKLPGERKPVFPDGVPGLEQGVPKNLYKGSAQEQIDQQNAQAAAAAAQPVETPKSKTKSKGRGKQPAGAAPAQDAAQAPAAPDGEAAPEEEGSTAAAPPAPKPKKIVRRRTTAPPPDAAAPQAAPQGQQAASPFPAPMPSSTFQR
jgi:hypothetical protein